MLRHQCRDIVRIRQWGSSVRMSQPFLSRPPIMLRHVLHPPYMVSTGNKRCASSFSGILGRVIRVPAYVGGGAAAFGSYVAYKANEAGQYTQEQLSKLKDFSSQLRDRIGEMFSSDGMDGRGEGGGSGSGDGGDNNSADTLAAVTVLASLSEDEQEMSDNRGKGSTVNEDEEEEGEDDAIETDNTEDEMLNLTKQMIEIRSILNKVDSLSANLTLPSIVVIGSQSSGKSSVLESIVGKDFLPKGSNMVTRRPIELTLVNTPHSQETTADFPAMRKYNLKDFKEVQRLLIEMNMAVPSTEAVSDEPIQLTIKSPRVPDLSLVDLPGYIQVEAVDQPVELKSKIRQLCDKYLEEPNIILAISAADVDLANSTALRASKIADPQGLRTIGVITKLDLVSPQTARDILNNRKYPLKMGYVGVITKNPDTNVKRLFDTGASSSGIFSKRENSQDVPKFAATKQFEKGYFASHKKDFKNCQVSTKCLREKLIKILEVSMSNALEPTSQLIQQELDDAAYLFKVEFNDRQLTPKSYLLNNVDILKSAVKQFQDEFTRNDLKSILKADLDQKVLDLLAARYWRDTNLSEISNWNGKENESSALYWHKKLELAQSTLTKIGVGRLSTTLVTNAILQELTNILNESQLRNHDLIKELVTNTAVTLLNSKYYSTADQVENCIKPFKYEIELEDRDWSLAREHSVALIREELRQCNDRYLMIKNSVGGRKLNQVMHYISTEKSHKETLGFSALLLDRGQEALFLQDRLTLLNLRLKLLKNKCTSVNEKDKCPEAFLNAVSDKLTSTAVLFLNVELLSDFFYNFPIELDKKLGLLSDEQIEMFAKEDPKIARHIELQKRKELLELALEKIDSILVFKKSYKATSRRLQ